MPPRLKHAQIPRCLVTITTIADHHRRPTATTTPRREAGFSYVIEGIPSSQISDWTAYLATALENYDVNLDWWIQNAERASLGLKCPYTFFEMSIMSATFSAESTATVWSTLTAPFSGPFDQAVWGTLIAMTFLTSVLYYLLESKVNEIDVEPEASRFTQYTRIVYLGAAEFVGGENFAPQTGWGRMVVLSFNGAHGVLAVIFQW